MPPEPTVFTNTKRRVIHTFNSIYRRRAVKDYDPEYEFTDETRGLMEAAMQAPTSFNIQN